MDNGGNVMDRSPEINELAQALVAAQAEMPNPLRLNVNPFFSKEGAQAMYADLADVIDTIEPSLTKNNIAILQPAENGTQPDSVSVTTMLLHKSGQWASSSLQAYPADKKPQTLGSCITYLRRYGLLAMVCRAGAWEDDDGNQASAVNKKKEEDEEGEESQELITEEQTQELEAKLAEADVDPKDFKRVFGISGKQVSALPAASFDVAMKKLKVTIDARSKKGTTK